MQEVAVAGEDHGCFVLVGCLDDVFVADGSPGLNRCSGTRVERIHKTVREGEHGVGSDHGSLEAEASLLSFPGGEAAGINAGHLAGSNSEGAVAVGEDNSIRLYVFHDSPAKTHRLDFLCGRRSLSHDLLLDLV